MPDKNKNSLLLVEILSSPWSTTDFSNEKVKIKGAVKADSLEIGVSEIDLIASLLDHKDPKVQIGATKILGLFKQNANAYVKKISELYSLTDEKERNEIIVALSSIGTLDALKALGDIVASQPSYDELFDIIFHIGSFFVDYPIESLEAILQCHTNEPMWGVIQGSFRKPLEKKVDNKTDSLREEIESFERIPIGISQEMERQRVTKNAVFFRIKQNMTLILQMEQSKNKDESKAAKIFIKKIRKLLK